MTVLPDLPALRALLRPGQRLIGIDPGSRTIGLALSDVGLTLATPHSQLKRGKIAPIAMEITRLARIENAGGLVVGLPLELDGRVGPAAEGQPDPGGFGIGVGRSRNRPMVGPNVVAEGDPDRHLALIDGEVGVHLGAGWIARSVDVPLMFPLSIMTVRASGRL